MTFLLKIFLTTGLSTLLLYDHGFNSEPIQVKPKTGFFKMDTLQSLPKEIPSVRGKLRRVFRVDFDGDGKPDFICQYVPEIKTDKGDFTEDWIRSDNTLIKRMPKFDMDYDFFWFVNIDGDIEPELFSATGYEDGIDYAMYDQNLKTGDQTLLFLFNPVIVENDKLYWGYPWDIQDIVLKKESGTVFLKASIDHDIERDGNITFPDSTKHFPAIFFQGRANQAVSSLESIRNIQWMPVQQLTKTSTDK